MKNVSLDIKSEISKFSLILIYNLEMCDLCETRLRGQMERGQGHNTNEVEAEARFFGLEAETLTMT